MRVPTNKFLPARTPGEHPSETAMAIAMAVDRNIGRYFDDPTTKRDLLKLEEKSQESIQQDTTDTGTENAERIELHQRLPRKQQGI